MHLQNSLSLIVLPALSWEDLLPHAGFGALAGATLAVLGEGARLLRARYRDSLEGLEGEATTKRQAADAALEAANQAELRYAGKKAEEQHRRDRQAMAALQQRLQQQRAAERQLQQQQQQEEGQEMEDLGAAASPTYPDDAADSSNGELK